MYVPKVAMPFVRVGVKGQWLGDVNANVLNGEVETDTLPLGTRLSNGLTNGELSEVPVEG